MSTATLDQALLDGLIKTLAPKQLADFKLHAEVTREYKIDAVRIMYTFRWRSFNRLLVASNKYIALHKGLCEWKRSQRQKTKAPKEVRDTRALLLEGLDELQTSVLNRFDCDSETSAEVRDQMMRDRKLLVGKFNTARRITKQRFPSRE